MFTSAFFLHQKRPRRVYSATALKVRTRTLFAAICLGTHQKSTGQHSPVPQGNDTVGEAGILVILTELARKAKVGQLEAALIVDEQVGCLEVAV